MSNFVGRSRYADPVLPDYNTANVTIREQKEKNDERRYQLLEQQRAADKRRKELDKFTNESLDFLLTESLFHLFSKCIPENINEALVNCGRSTISSFVIEEGSRKLLEQFKPKTLFLSGLSSIVEQTHKKVLHDCDGKDAPFRINNSELDNFHKKLDNLDTDEITKTIVARVTKAEEDFIAANIHDKELMETMATKTQEKINGVRSKDPDLETAIKQEHAAMYRQDIQSKVINRRKGILESIVTAMSTNVVSNDIIREQFTKTDGKLDTNKIIETAEIMYTVLEMVNTIRAKDITSEYLIDIIKSIK